MAAGARLTDRLEELRRAFALEQEKLLRRADEEHEVWRQMLQETFLSLAHESNKDLTQVSEAYKPFSQLQDLRAAKPVLPSESDPTATVPVFVQHFEPAPIEEKVEGKAGEISEVSNGLRPQSEMSVQRQSSTESESCCRCRFFPCMDYVAGFVVFLNTILMLAQLELDGRVAARFIGAEPLDYGNELQIMQVAEASFVFFYIVELCLRIWVQRWSFFKDVANIFDTFLVVLGTVDVIVSNAFGEYRMRAEDPLILKLMRSLKSLRALRLVRTFRFVQGLRLLVTACRCFLPSLFWAMVLLAVFITMGALTLGTTLQGFITTEGPSMQEKIWVWQRYGTAFRALYTMYEVTFAGNWPTNSRPVLEAVSPIFATFYVGYITIIVFALIKVISALFLKDTLDAAQSDAKIAVKDKKDHQRKYIQKLERLFTAMDVDKTGMITQEELAHVLSLPNVHAHLETLEVDVKESAALFNLLDDGDGQVTREEFISGILLCKGPARAIDQVIMQSEMRQLARRLDELCQNAGLQKDQSMAKTKPKINAFRSTPLEDLEG